MFEIFPACSNETVIPEVRLNDVLSERLIRQVWNDIRAKLSDDGEFRGMKIDPLDIGDIHQNQKCKNDSDKIYICSCYVHALLFSIRVQRGRQDV